MPDLLLTDGFHATPHHFLWHPATGTAIIADLHLGIEAALNDRGIGLPAMNLRAMTPAWLKLCERLTAARGRLIIAGDFFDSPTPGPAAVTEARTLLAQLCASVPITLLPGNHDPSAECLRLLFPAAPIEVMDHATVGGGGYTVIHGDRSPQQMPRGLIVGHQHPCVVLADRVQSAKMTCFAWGQLPVGETTLLLLPAFSTVSLGSNLRTRRNWILDLPRPADSQMHIAGIVEQREQVLDFGTLADQG